jgi:transposase, IS5 family
VRDRLSVRAFCRVYLQEVPDDTTLIRWANLIQPKTWERFNQRIVQLAVERPVTKGRKLRSDGTVVEANLTPPSDSRLLADSVRVLARTLVRGPAVLHAAGKKIQSGFEDGRQQAKRLARQIGEMLRSKQAYRELLHLTEPTMAWADHTQKQLKKRSQQSAQRLVEHLAHFVPLVQKVSQQATRRILQGEQVAASEKIVSLFEEHTDLWNMDTRSGSTKSKAGW